MTNENKDQKLFYTMNEVSEMFDITQTQLRNWVARFPMLKPHRNRKGNRLFTIEDIEMLKIAHNLIVVKGLRIDSAVREMSYDLGLLQRKSEVVEKLTHIKSVLLYVRSVIDEQSKETADKNSEKEEVVYISTQ